MARKPKSSTSRRPAASVPARAAATTRDKIVDALMALLADKPIEQIGFAEIASEAGVSLADLRGEFGSTLAIVAAHIKDIDRAVLAGGDADMTDESPRERLFDVLMRRLDLLADHKAAARSLLRSARRNPGLALALNTMAVRSAQWMLTAAGITASGPQGMIRSQGLALMFANVVRIWIDDDADQARTLAALDRELARGQRLVGLIDDLCAIPARVCEFTRRARQPRRRGRDDRAAA